MRQDEAGDHHRVVPKSVELGIREAEDDCQDRGTDIAEEDGPEARNVPVAVATNDIVEVAAELIALSWLAGLLTYEVR